MAAPTKSVKCVATMPKKADTAVVVAAMANVEASETMTKPTAAVLTATVRNAAASRSATLVHSKKRLQQAIGDNSSNTTPS